MDYEYDAKILKIDDGDTIKVSLRLKKTRLKSGDLGCSVYIEDGYICQHAPIRFMGINAPEHGTTAGDAATAWLSSEIKIGDVVRIKTIKDATEKYGRLLGYVTRAGDADTLNNQIVAAGHALPWDGHGVRPV